ncbi:hypothetical protein [Bacillus paranthracis]
MFIKLINLKKEELVLETNKVLNKKLYEVRDKNEPHIVTHLAKNIAELNHCWLSILNDDKNNTYKYISKLIMRHTEITVSSVFVHQRPYLKFNNGKDHQCEIGDILFLHLLGNQWGSQQMQSILFQAKKVKSNTHYLVNDELTQLYLYEKWPPFNWKYPKAYKTDGAYRNILPKESHEGGRYLMINTSENKFMTSSAKKQLEAEKSLGLEIIELLNFMSGKKVHRKDEDDKVNNVDNDWSKVIKEIYRIGVSKPAKLKSYGKPPVPRDEVVGNKMALEDFMSFLNYDEFVKQIFSRDASINSEIPVPEILDGRVIPVILIRTRFSKVRRKNFVKK